MSLDAHFVNPSSEDFQLKADSPCIDTGIVVDSGDYDFSLKTRIINGKIDIGCLEYSPANSVNRHKTLSKKEDCSDLIDVLVK